MQEQALFLPSNIFRTSLILLSYSFLDKLNNACLWNAKTTADFQIPDTAFMEQPISSLVPNIPQHFPHLSDIHNIRVIRKQLVFQSDSHLLNKYKQESSPGVDNLEVFPVFGILIIP